MDGDFPKVTAFSTASCRRGFFAGKDIFYRYGLQALIYKGCKE
jgi:hypothetical protein